MRTVAEIESAIQRLSQPELSELAAWFEEYQQMINASAEVFAIYNREESSERGISSASTPPVTPAR